MADTVTDSLLHCPFCGESLIKTGAEHVIWAHPVRSLEEAKCPGVGVHIYPGDTSAIAAWNRRTAPAEPVAVKPLEWHSTDDEMGRNNLCWRACPKIGPAYTITGMVHGQLGSRWEVYSLGEHFATPDEAKAAAQADYEARIRSALASPTEMVEPTRDDIIRECSEAWDNTRVPGDKSWRDLPTDMQVLAVQCFARGRRSALGGHHG